LQQDVYITAYFAKCKPVFYVKQPCRIDLHQGWQIGSGHHIEEAEGVRRI
jgi:hypothetical protein